MQLDYAKQSDDALLPLLSYEDMRIRQKAQFELASRGAKGAAVLNKAIAQMQALPTVLAPIVRLRKEELA